MSAACPTDRQPSPARSRSRLPRSQRPWHPPPPAEGCSRWPRRIHDQRADQDRAPSASRMRTTIGSTRATMSTANTPAAACRRHESNRAGAVLQLRLVTTSRSPSSAAAAAATTRQTSRSGTARRIARGEVVEGREGRKDLGRVHAHTQQSRHPELGHGKHENHQRRREHARCGERQRYAPEHTAWRRHDQRSFFEPTVNPRASPLPSQASTTG